MTDARDPKLEALFDAAREDLSGEAFGAGVMAQVDRLRRRTLVGWGAAAIALLAGAWLLSDPLIGAAGLLAQLLPQSLVEIDAGDRLLGQLLAPVNSVAAIVALALFALRFAYRKIFG